MDQALAGDQTAENNVQVMSFFDMEGDGLSFGQDSPLVVAKAFGPAATAVDDSVEGTQRLAMSFDVSAILVMQRDGKPAFVPVKKTMTYWLVPNGLPERPWLIDAFEGAFSFDPALDTLPAPAE